MNLEQLKNIQHWFFEYASTFREDNGKLLFPLQMKMEHSARVVEDSRTLARQAGWNEEDVHVAEAVAWLHDVARFSQFKEFRTFHDPRSVNHGERGWEILTQQALLVACDPLDRQCILDGVRYHNRKTIPGESAEDSLRFVKLIRDADKIDIYKIFHDSLEQKLFEQYPEALLHVSMEGSVNPAILAEVKLRQNPSYQHIKTLADFLLIQISWIYDVNFVPSLRLIRERGVLGHIAEHLPPDPEVQAVLKDAGVYLEQRCQEG